MARKKKTRNKTGLFISCPCGSRAGISRTDWGYYSHCPRCGRLCFFRNDSLLERIKLGAKTICDHDIELKACKGGQTGWCPKCRLRVFAPMSS